MPKISISDPTGKPPLFPTYAASEGIDPGTLAVAPKGRLQSGAALNVTKPTVAEPPSESATSILALEIVTFEGNVSRMPTSSCTMKLYSTPSTTKYKTGLTRPPSEST